jgi:putative alpha-1,2-mannosidase
MKEDFDSYDWGGEYCEGSAWQNSFGIYHDFEGLADLHGGKDCLFKKIDELFASLPKYNVGDYGEEIHEMTEMAAADFGQCAISNQPSFHIPYIYSALGCQEKTDYWVARLVNETFSSSDDGFPGDEDNGSMAGWYVFSCLGFYPICPGKDEYIKGIKLVDKATINGIEIDVNKITGNIIKHSEFSRV